MEKPPSQAKVIIVFLCLVSFFSGQPIKIGFSSTSVKGSYIWSIETVDSAGDVGYDTSIAVDSNDNPHISYHGETNNDVKYARWTGSAWSVETVDSNGDIGWYSSIALDSLDNPYISYNDRTNGDLKYARWTGSSWSIEVVDSVGFVGRYPSIELDSGDKPHIGYYDQTNGDLKYARWTGTEWNIEIVDSTGDVGRYSSLELDSGDKPHIGYYDDTNGDLKYARWTGSAWSIETVDSAGDVGKVSSLALDSGDKPHISYHDYVGNRDLKYARWTGSSWNIEVVDSVGNVGRYATLSLDSVDNPHISYWDVTNADLKYARWTGSFWSIEIVDSAGEVGQVSSIALDSGDNPHISYRDKTNLDLKYARGRIEFQYHFRASPYSNVFHVNVDANGWINGYMDGGPEGWNPVLGKVEGDRVCMAIDIYPDETPGHYETAFLIWRVSTMTGQFIMTNDGMSYLGPYNVNIVFVGESASGRGFTDVTQPRVAQGSWYTFSVNPYTDIVHIYGNPGGWLNGYEEPAHPVLGFTEGDRWYFAVDRLGAQYTLTFNAGSRSTLEGEMIRTEDGKAYDGPHDIWLTSVSP